MTDYPSTDPLLTASRVLGAERLFRQMVQLVASKQPVAISLAEQVVCERLAALQEQFARDCATIVELHLGRQQALQSMAVLATAPLQQFLAARWGMAPALALHLQALRKQIEEMEL
jgi:hypothetical protein